MPAPSVAPGSGEAPALPVVDTTAYDDAAFDWLVPAASLSVPGMLIVGSVVLQALGGVVWLPAVGRRFRGVADRGRRRGRGPRLVWAPRERPLQPRPMLHALAEVDPPPGPVTRLPS